MRLFLVLCFVACSTMLFAQNTAWQRVNPLPYGETVVSIQKIPGTNRLIAACQYSSVLISDNGGETWQTIMYPANMPSGFQVSGLYFYNNTTGFIYGKGVVVLKTTDAGLTWHICPFDDNVHREIISMVMNTDWSGYAIGESGVLYETNNEGETWHQKNLSNLVDYRFTSLAFSENSEGFITGVPVFTYEYGILRTHNYGNNWQLEPSPEGIPYEITNIHFISSSTGFLSAATYIYRTDDGGETWQVVFNDSTLHGTTPYCFKFYNSLKGIAYQKSGPYPSAFYLTSDGGLTWQPVNMPEEDICCNDLVYYNENTLFSAGNNGCLFKSADGGLTWEKISHHSFSGRISDLHMFNESDGIFVDKIGEPWVNYVLRSNDFNTFDTILVTETDYSTFKIDFQDQDTGYVVSHNVNDKLLIIWRTTNGGESWIIDTLENQDYFKNVDFCNVKNGLISFTRNIFLTTDGGNTWKEKSFAPDVRIENACYSSVSRIYISAKDQSGPLLFVSPDNGQTWSMIIETVPRAGRLFFIDEMSGFMIADSLLYKTTNGGYNWTRCSTNVPRFRISDISFPSPDTGYIAGKSNYENVLKTTDGGLTWNPVHAPDVLPYSDVEFIDNESGYIVSGNVIHKTTTGGTLGKEPPPLIAPKFHAYPNPFQSGIRIDVSDRSILTGYSMNVFSLNGIELYGTIIQPQTTSIWFQASMLPPGTYFIQFRSGTSVIETIKVVKVK